jgi:hypothetical protein
MDYNAYERPIALSPFIVAQIDDHTTYDDTCALLKILLGARRAFGSCKCYAVGTPADSTVKSALAEAARKNLLRFIECRGSPAFYAGVCVLHHLTASRAESTMGLRILAVGRDAADVALLMSGWGIETGVLLPPLALSRASWVDSLMNPAPRSDVQSPILTRPSRCAAEAAGERWWIIDGHGTRDDAALEWVVTELKRWLEFESVHGAEVARVCVVAPQWVSSPCTSADRRVVDCGTGSDARTHALCHEVAGVVLRTGVFFPGTRARVILATECRGARESASACAARGMFDLITMDSVYEAVAVAASAARTAVTPRSLPSSAKTPSDTAATRSNRSVILLSTDAYISASRSAPLCTLAFAP